MHAFVNGQLHYCNSVCNDVNNQLLLTAQDTGYTECWCLVHHGRSELYTPMLSELQSINKLPSRQLC